jgi:hypothetical protein
LLREVVMIEERAWRVEIRLAYDVQADVRWENGSG